ncbi:PucR family transcriptional regulator [Caballeronia sordidicola]|uniref:PucR family transcriptional regulator n=1 Tax=Caballeronia sordidicola TaxID=196367 RepID=UPI001F346F98|nr:helix-turn-helix domain-containing protein [Caballeronia sordidicola]
MNIKLYADLDSPTKLDIRNSIAWASKLWFDTLLSGNAPSAEGLEVFREYGRRRVYQGLPLDALLRAFRLGSRELWCFYIELNEKNDDLRDELLFRISPFLMEFFDILAQIISQTFLDEQYKQARWREALRYQLHTIIFFYPEDTEGFLKTAAALRLDGTIPRIALAIDVRSIDSHSPTFKSELDRIVAATARRLRLPVDSLFDNWYCGKLLVWIPARLGDLMGMSDLQVGKQIVSIAETMPEIKAIGIGLTGEGAAGWAMSAEEAIRALSSERGRGGEERVRLYSEIVVEESVRGTKNALRYLVSLVEQLESEPELLETLETYFDQLQRRKVTASVLGIHPNTLNYRLDRIENILGARLDDASWVSKLDIAIKLRRSTK